MSPTMKDVATLAGVSIKSVSRVVNDHPGSSPELRTRVERAIASLGWRPNENARSLRTGRTGFIALSVTDLRHSGDATLAQELVSEATHRGLRVSIEPTHGAPERRQQTLTAVGTLFDAAVLIHPSAQEMDELTSSYASPGLAICTRSHGTRDEGEKGSTDPGILTDLVLQETVETAQSIARHLGALGRKEIVVLGDIQHPEGSLTGQLEAAFPGASVLGATGADHRRSGWDLAGRALAEHPATDALVCADDRIAIGALTRLLDLGIPVPDQVSITGYGDSAEGRFTTPSLTTVSIHEREIARRTIEILVSRLAGTTTRRAPARVASTLVRGESTLGVVSGPRASTTKVLS